MASLVCNHPMPKNTRVCYWSDDFQLPEPIIRVSHFSAEEKKLFNDFEELRFFEKNNALMLQVLPRKNEKTVISTAIIALENYEIEIISAFNDEPAKSLKTAKSLGDSNTQTMFGPPNNNNAISHAIIAFQNKGNKINIDTEQKITLKTNCGHPHKYRDYKAK